jgi:hypothetical protein
MGRWRQLSSQVLAVRCTQENCNVTPDAAELPNRRLQNAIMFSTPSQQRTYRYKATGNLPKTTFPAYGGSNSEWPVICPDSSMSAVAIFRQLTAQQLLAYGQGTQNQVLPAPQRLVQGNARFSPTDIRS